MPQPTISVTEKLPESSTSAEIQVPDSFSEVAAVLSSLGATVSGLAEIWPSNRRAGSRGVEVIFGFLVAFFSQPCTRSLREFSGHCRGAVGRVLAALIGQREWLTQSTLSRALSSCTDQDADTMSAWLLTKGLARPKSSWLNSALAGMRDTNGDLLHVFDLDPTGMAMRQRALPEGEGLPEPKRRARGLAAPGHRGRKRGQIVVSRVPVQHAGSGMWVGNFVYRGNADGRESTAKGIKQIREWCEHMGVDASRALLRFDGGVQGGIEVCQNSNFEFVTRMGHYKPLSGEDVRAHLQTAAWTAVPDSRSGPRRTATELGLISISGREPVRVVATRYRNTGKGAGKVIGKDRYELFATSLDAGAWPAAELAALYFQRSAQENQFAREDAEFRLDRAYSFSLPGFQIVTTIGLFVWNLRTLHGAEIQNVKVEELPAQGKRETKITEAPNFSEEAATESEPSEDEDPKTAPLRAVEATLSTRIVDSLTPEGWKLEPGGLRCPNGALLKVRSNARVKSGRSYALMRVGKGVCRDCPLRSQCTTSTSPTFRREVSFPITPASTFAPATLAQTPEWSPPPAALAGKFAVCGQHIRTATLRRTASKVLSKIRMIVSVPKLNRRRVSEWLAVDDASRQQRRKTIDDRLSFNRLAEPAKVHIFAPRAALRLLGGGTT